MTHMGLPRTARLFTMLAALAAPPFLHADSLAELRDLVQAGDGRAWEMAARMEPAHAGDPDFDLYYGLAAQQAGQPQQALFAFERVYLAYPGNQRAKLELARAYYETGNTAEAERLFSEVLAASPPEPVQRAIRTYMDAIAAQRDGSSLRVGGTVSLAVGYDSNVNSATDVLLHNIGIFTVALAPTSMEQDSAYVDAGVTVEVTRPTGRRSAQFATASLSARDNEDILSGGNYDNLDGGVAVGYLLEQGSNLWRFPLALQGLAVESDETRYVATLGAEVSRPLSARHALLGFGQVGNAHYPGEEERNTWLALAGAGLSWSAADVPVRVTATAYVGTEPAEDDNFEFSGRDYAALRLGSSWAPVDRHTFTASAGLQQSEFRAVNPVIGLAREEMLVDAVLGWEWQLADDLALALDGTWAQNDSDGNALFDFERTQGSLGVTWRY